MAAQRIEFSQDDVDLIDRLVKDGVYADAAEAVHEGLRLLEREQLSRAERLATFRAEARKGFDDLDHGDYTEVSNDQELSAHISRLSDLAAQRVAERRAER
ncbi:hypothetical protein [Nocardioides sp.]|uniref:hypothetical protein n=1 Tax=Nocardioides sp. TaxID=35761 RepID=UPI0026334C27|nr:hypothetical protein [Nocardioides sp.]